MTGDKKDPTIDENLARIRELVESVKKPESAEKKDSGDTPRGDAPPAQSDNSKNPTQDEATAQNLARKGAVDSASRTPLTDYISKKMPDYLDTPAKRPTTHAGEHIESLPTADNGFNEPFVKASVSALDDDEKPAPFVTGVSSQQIKPRADSETDDEIPQTVLDTLLQSDEKGKVHIRSGVNAPAFTSPHSVQVSINRENRRTLEEISQNPKKQATIASADSVFSNMQPKNIAPDNTDDPLVLTDVLVLDEVITEEEQDNTAPQVPPQSTMPSQSSSPLKKQADDSSSDQSAPDQSAPDESAPDESVIIRIRTAMEHLKQTKIEKAPFDSAVQNMVETEVRPYVKKWVNDNIADVVERQVDTEIQKILNRI